MKFYTLIKEILNTLRMEKAEFQRLTGINPVNITWWEQHPETLPQMKTIKRIEQGLGIVFEFDDDGRPTGWMRTEVTPQSETNSIPGVPMQEKPLSIPRTGKPLNASAGEYGFPGSPEELYSQSDSINEKPEWSELPNDEREFYERLYQVLLLEVDEVNTAYEQTLAKAALRRSHAIEDARQKVRRAILNHTMGEIRFRSDMPM